jgi:hypothetical protein
MSERVLLVTPEFYGLEKKIKTLLQEIGYEVEWIQNKDFPLNYKGKRSKFKLIRRIYFFLFFPRERYINRELKNINNLCFDILFTINCNIVCPYLIKRLKGINPRIFAILYLWDSFSMYSWEKEIKLFNKTYTFDRADSEKYHIEYFPLFYIPSKEIKKEDIRYDISFVGKFSPERLSLIDKLIPQLSGKGIIYKIYLWPAYKKLIHNRLLYFFLKKTNLKGNWICSYILHYEANEMLLAREYINEHNLCYEDAQNIHMMSNVVLDLPFDEQTGYSLRLVAALALGRKVITTNSYISQEVFYNSDQIHLLDTKNPVVCVKWIKGKTHFKPDPYFSRLELSKWLNYILNAGIA